jgi:putative transposase
LADHLDLRSAGCEHQRLFEHWRRKDTDKPSKAGVSKRISDEALLVHIKAIRAEVKQEYGWP